MRRLWTTALDLLYPPRCCSCSSPTAAHDFCEQCMLAITPLTAPLCTICGIPFLTRDAGDHPCADCLRKPPPFRRARAVATYDAADQRDNPLKSVLQRYKYNHDVSLAPALARLVSRRLPVRLAEYDVIIPVPLHPSRLRWRGFNQALMLARRLQPAAPIPIDPFSLRRVRPTRPQVELDQDERKTNVTGAFDVVRSERIHKRRVLLVDDVFTTGATVNECSRTLRRAGAELVDVLVIARAVLR